ncbi:Ectoine hydroxylase-related dioxygenase, phytanoyl-CoA dioxygenase (PhyH) family [Dyadobacter soli]|uniref:Ectoine hydroxylase-related dioxygenase, phytanoyl-CoA dioxygenase (PhyH) family n=1 Tax=Dyadobacter soli TaxID=659014 RepID=A0A1G7VJA8_9BACT|nr:phytanoyl-CoA dioxygenase family protein [Dyadobacter soli]SDG59489.1 Ectoine hydroxylase-related dioxygenase, phytanoyl-CoA dioxygenase (PhyH) family [Dyadobacter soli]
MKATPLTEQQIEFYNTNGYLVVEDLISPEEVQQYKALYDDFLAGKINVGTNRSDLGADLGNSEKVENITQIMWPSDFIPELLVMPYHLRALAISKQLMGEDSEMDFDMLINKSPFTNTITPWHQDEAYWLNVPDKRATSCWLSLDYATLDSGCMWFVPGSNLREVRQHAFAAKKGGALSCNASEDEGVSVELKPGSCTFHHGRTLHYSRGNSTGGNRRAFIINFRPADMIRYEREHGFDHGKQNAGNRQLQNDEFAK